MESAFEADFHHHWKRHEEANLDEGLGCESDLKGFVVYDLFVCA